MSRFHCKTWRQTKVLYFSGILMSIKKIMSYAETATTREASNLCMQIMQNPDDMICWLKFGHNNLIVNSACTRDYLMIQGSPKRLPEGRGLYRNWGAYFDFNEIIEIPGGIQTEGIIMERWSISFWTILPLPNLGGLDDKVKPKHVLIQNVNGTGAYIQVDHTCQKLQMVCEKTGREISADVDLKEYKKGWHNIIVVCDNLDPGCEGAVSFYIDGIKKVKNKKPCICIQPIGYIGNSKNG